MAAAHARRLAPAQLRRHLRGVRRRRQPVQRAHLACVRGRSADGAHRGACPGAPRSTFRRNDQVVTFLPEAQGRARARSARTSSCSPTCWAVAGFVDRRVLRRARDRQGPRRRLRRRRGAARCRATACASATASGASSSSGLVVKLQTLDGDGKVIEQSAFSELQLDAPVKMRRAGADDGQHRGLPRREVRAASAPRRSARAGRSRQPVAGFKPINCYQAPDGRRRRSRTHDAMDVLRWPGLGVAVRRALRCAAPAAGRRACAGRHLHADAPADRQGRRLVADRGRRSAAADARGFAQSLARTQ